MEIFNNREIALGIWTLIVIILAVLKEDIRASFHHVWQAFFHPVILTPLGLLFAYIGIVVYGLSEVGLWDFSQLKNTILWCISVAAVSFFRITEVAEDHYYFRNAIKDNFKIIALVEFVVTFYTFPLIVELILVPLTTFLAVMQGVTRRDKKYKAVESLMSNLLLTIGSGATIYGLYNLVIHFDSFAWPETLTDFTVPVVLSLLLLPYIFLFSLYVTYERAIARIRLSINEEELIQYATRAVIFGFHVRTKLLNRWLRLCVMRPPASKKEIKETVARIKSLAAHEKRPPDVPRSEGWSPYIAVDYLAQYGLVMNDYHPDPYDDQNWSAWSAYLEIGNGVLKDSISYYVYGDERVARLLKLKADFYDAGSGRESRELFTSIAGELFYRAFDAVIPEEVHTKIVNEETAKVLLNNEIVEIAKEAWPSGRGYSMRLTILHKGVEL